MAYTLKYSGNQTGGNVLITVPDSSVYSVGNITIPGRNFNGYGSPVDQNMLSMLEHFASSAGGPSLPVTGQLWYDKSNASLKYNVSDSSTPSWASVPQTDANGNATYGNLGIVGDLTVGGVISGNGSGLFDINAANLTGTISAARLSGTYNININGNVNGNVTGDTVIADNFIGIGNLVDFTNVTNVSLGAVGNVHISGGSYGQVLTTNGAGNLVWSTVSGGGGGGGFANGTSNTSIPVANGNVTTSVGGVANVWVVSATGANLTGTLNATDITTGANTTAGTITGNWTLTTGSRLQATYADLAERHHADSNYAIGTVMTVGGKHEVTKATIGDRAIGVVSDQYAYLMNGDAGPDSTHPAIAYVGRVQVRVVGPINKHDTIVPTIGGCAERSTTGEIMGWALETSTDANEKLVLCVIK